MENEALFIFDQVSELITESQSFFEAFVSKRFNELLPFQVTFNQTIVFLLTGDGLFLSAKDSSIAI